MPAAEALGSPARAAARAHFPRSSSLAERPQFELPLIKRLNRGAQCTPRRAAFVKKLDHASVIHLAGEREEQPGESNWLSESKLPGGVKVDIRALAALNYREMDDRSVAGPSGDRSASRRTHFVYEETKTTSFTSWIAEIIPLRVHVGYIERSNGAFRAHV
ncbi:hypothetical protein EYF80_050423 [Liparis tanakae]|uniref:Uncharacterized protein n=1 Tax=Liparis tanakae TaxID=230148 RepID=A0A4Z2FG59_9TELE|nr:hypothetical protein EYF80_050423 [Liparis tanakae]